MTTKIKKPKFFLPGDKVKIKGEDGIFIIGNWDDSHVEVDEDDLDEKNFQESDPRNGKDYKDWEYSTTVSAWHNYQDITLVEAGWMRKML